MLRGCDAAATAERAVPRTGRSWSRTAGRPNAVGRGTKRRESISPQPAPTSCARRVAAGGATEEPANEPAIPFVVGEGGSGTLSKSTFGGGPAADGSGAGAGDALAPLVIDSVGEVLKLDGALLERNPRQLSPAHRVVNMQDWVAIGGIA